MTLKFKLPTAFSDTTLPKLQPDPVMPEAGALMLLEPAHPANPWASGVPADATSLPNVAEAQALTMLGSSTATDVRPVMKRSAGFTGSAGLIERTSKGGLHGIVPQGGNGVNGTGPIVQLTNKINRYFLQNYTHTFYMGLWIKVTRLPSVNATGLVGLATGAQQTNSCLMYFGLQANNTVTGRPGQAPADAAFVTALETLPYPPVAGNLWVNETSKDYYNRVNNGVPTTPSPSTGAYTTAASAVGWGNTVTAESIGLDGTVSSKSPLSTVKDGGPSFVLYRLYIEDLTVSARSYSTVRALDLAEYTKQLVTAGGRYVGDTFTDPATIA